METKSEKLVIPNGITISVGGMPFKLTTDIVVVGTRENLELAMKDSKVINDLLYSTLTKMF